MDRAIQYAGKISHDLSISQQENSTILTKSKDQIDSLSKLRLSIEHKYKIDRLEKFQNKINM